MLIQRELPLETSYMAHLQRRDTPADLSSQLTFYNALPGKLESNFYFTFFRPHVQLVYKLLVKTCFYTKVKYISIRIIFSCQ